jgi:poly-beta-1,6-N-acetyl-D-glucosamine synthase
VTHPLTYAVITPARNEAENLPRLAAALAAQTHSPRAWIVVDDGSTDATPAIVGQLAAENAWVHHLDRSSSAGLGLANGRREGRDLDGFRAGLAALPRGTDVFVKVDADVDFDARFFEELTARFAADPLLGIASGTCYESEHGRWVRRSKNGTTVWGATRAYRSVCLPDVMALEPRMGWDGLDELRVQLRGMRTQTYVDLPFRHHRAEGGRELTSLHHGEALGRASWYMGYRPSYLALRAIWRARTEPAALAMVYGYASAAVRREPRYEDTTVVRALRDRQRLRETFRRGAPAS